MERTTLLAAAVVIGTTLFVTVRTATAPGPTPARAATPAERIDIARDIAGNENGWTNETAQNFPADRWSQSDDFHGREYKKAQEIAKAKGVRIEDVLGAIDDDIHRPVARPGFLVGGGTSLSARHADAVPCKPRPFYD